MALTNVDLFRIDSSTGSLGTVPVSNLKNPSSVSNNIVLNSDGTTTLTPSNIIKSGVAVNSTSGTSIDFTGIPSWVKRVTVMFNGVSTNGASNYLVQLGTSGGVESSGYDSSLTTTGAGVSQASSTAGFLFGVSNASASCSGHAILTLISGNTWISSLVFKGATASNTGYQAGSKTLSGTLDRIRITTVSGTDTFDAGSINILMEG